MKSIIKTIIRLLSSPFSYRIFTKWTAFKDYCHNCWISTQVGQIGEGSSIGRDCFLDGGGSKRIIIGKNTTIGRHSVLGVWKQYGNQSFAPKLQIGDDCHLGEFNHISTIDSVVIGNGLLTGRFVIISDNNHGEFNKENVNVPPIKRELSSKGGIVIGDNVWIGDKCTILSGVSIGNGCIIAANSVVTQNVPSYTVVAGVPAKIIKQLSDEQKG